MQSAKCKMQNCAHFCCGGQFAPAEFRLRWTWRTNNARPWEVAVILGHHTGCPLRGWRWGDRATRATLPTELCKTLRTRLVVSLPLLLATYYLLLFGGHSSPLQFPDYWLLTTDYYQLTLTVYCLLPFIFSQYSLAACSFLFSP